MNVDIYIKPLHSHCYKHNELFIFLKSILLIQLLAHIHLHIASFSADYHHTLEIGIALKKWSTKNKEN